MATRLNLMVGGPKGLLPVDWMQAPGQWVAADRGVLYLLQHGIQPVVAVGDYDSLTPEEHAFVQRACPELQTFPPEKDATDTQLLLRRAIALGADEYVLYAGTGGRLDHALANMFLAVDPEFAGIAAQLHLTDATNWVDFLPQGQHVLHRRPGFNYLGITTLTAVRELTIEGAKYPLHGWSSPVPFSWASNEFVGDQPVTVALKSGTAVAIYSHDRLGQKRDN